jgi:predicted GH43/DUF377 family glycosyl hydrolase
MHPTPRVERLNGGEPLLGRIETHPWESKVTFNPACVLVEDRAKLRNIIPALPFDDGTKKKLASRDALCFLFYRAQGKKTESYDYTRSSLGLAVLSPALELLARHGEPVITPDQTYDNLGVEDARISSVGGTFVMFYTAYASASPENVIRIALASSTDLVHWTKHGLLKGSFNAIHNKNAMLFEGQSGGKYVMLHRPMTGTDAMAIHWAEAEDIFGEWTDRGVLMKPIPHEGFIDTWIGGGAPPLRLSDNRYLVLFHIGNRKADTSREYDFGLAVVDLTAAEKVTRRIDPFLRPQTPAETKGDADLGVNNVVFVCGAYRYKGDLYFPYAGADSVVLGGKISGAELDRYAGQ